MAGLEGTIKTPIGTVQKKTALILGGGVAALVFIVWYRQKSLGESTDSLAAAGEALINPATGYPYGSAEDAAALTAQGAYQSPGVPSTPGGSAGYPSNTGYVSNGQWVQAVIEYMVGNNLIEEPAQLSSALGKYITGSYVTDSEVALINQAIAVQGFPPVASPNGYPPSLNRQATGPTTPTTPAGTPAAPRLHHVNTTREAAILQWAPAANAVTYTVYMTGGKVAASGVKETSSVAGVNSAGKRSSTTSNVVTVKTKK